MLPVLDQLDLRAWLTVGLLSEPVDSPAIRGAVVEVLRVGPYSQLAGQKRFDDSGSMA